MQDKWKIRLFLGGLILIFAGLMTCVVVGGIKHASRFQPGTLVYDRTICHQYLVLAITSDGYDLADEDGKEYTDEFIRIVKDKSQCAQWDPPETATMPIPDVPPAGTTN